MRKITVLYDANCGFCRRCRWWLAEQPKYVEMDFAPAGGPEARRRYPGLEGAEEELTVVDDRGGVYRGTDAWILCLYALVEYREWSIRLSRPGWKPLARSLFNLISSKRKWFGGPAPACGHGCNLPRPILPA